ncbi:MAG: NAD(P)/FAD-dependent oxidoreductase [Patescibacteria group bacterium]
MRIAIIGGGPAGMMCAATICEANPSAKIYLIDRNNHLGAKVIISGGGRCNVTTGINDVKTVLKNYPRGGKFLTKATYAFPPSAVYDWFESHGVPLKVQDDMRVFPVSDNGKDVVRIFEKIFDELGVCVMLNQSVESVQKKKNEFFITVKNKKEPLIVDKLVITTGGQAYRKTGSKGDGYAFAQSLGHTITPLAPSLSALCTKEKWPAKVSGLSFGKATIKALGKKIYSFTGPFLFTHKGVSGPAVFALSSLVAFEKQDAKHPLQITIDLFPDDTLERLCARSLRLIEQNKTKQLINIIGLFVPKSLAQIVVDELSLSASVRADQVAKKEINACIDWLKSVPLTVVSAGAGDEFVTAGGVELSEIDSKTMESKVCLGLYFAGEVMNVDGFTGGFNLQASWATGRVAGKHVGYM